MLAKHRRGCHDSCPDRRFDDGGADHRACDDYDDSGSGCELQHDDDNYNDNDCRAGARRNVRLDAGRPDR